MVWFGLDDGEEPAFKYIVNDDDSLSYAANVWAPRSVIEELPAHIKNEKDIRDVLNFLSKDKEFMANLEDEDF